MTNKTEEIINGLRALHADTTPGKWGKGASSHHTVSKRDGKEPYRIAEFHHAADAAFCDYAHANVPSLLDRIAQLEAERRSLIHKMVEQSKTLGIMIAEKELSLQAQLAQRQVPADSLLSLESSAHEIFNNPPSCTSQEVRDVIEWYAASVRVALAFPTSQPAAMLAASPTPPRREVLSAKEVGGLLESAGYWPADATRRADFINGLRYGEMAHGIKGEEDGK